MNKFPNVNIYNGLKEIKSKLKLLYDEYKTKYENEKDIEKKNELKEKIIEIVKEYNKANAYLKKYYSLFSSLSTCDSTLQSKITFDINALEKEITDYYGIDKEKKELSSSKENSIEEAKDNNSSSLKKGEKHRVKNIIKSVSPGIKAVVEIATSVLFSYLTLDSIRCLSDYSGVLSVILASVTFVPVAAVSAIVATGCAKFGIENIKKSKKLVKKENTKK